MRNNSRRGSKLVAIARDSKQSRTTPVTKCCPPPGMYSSTHVDGAFSMDPHTVPEDGAVASASPRRPLQVISPANNQSIPLWQTAPPVAKRPRLQPSSPPGIPNLGNTCYLNSILQALVNCPHFCNALRNACHELPSLAPQGIAHSLLACSVHHAACRDSLLDPRALRHALHAFTPQFQPFLQHDAHELFCALTNALQQEVVHAEV